MRVLELSDRDEAAAYCGKLFARWGADVIRVERPDRVPSPRHLELYLHRGKERVAIDAHDPAGRARIDALAAECDILVTDVSARETDALAVETLGAASPRLVRVSITPFGLSGPYRDFEATASTLLALGGYTVLMGDRGRAPLTMPGNYAYYQAADFAFVAAQAAQLAAERGTAPARLIEVSVLESLATLHQFTDTMWLANGVVRSRHGNRWQNLCPTTLLPCADGWFGMNVLQTFWLPFAHWIGRPDWADPEHPLGLNAGRMEHEDEVEDAVVSALGGLTRRELFTEGQETWRVPVGHAAQLGELLDDRHLAHRAFFETLEGERGADGAAVRAPGSPFRLSGAASAPGSAPPAS
ncbi:MAG: CoA transferase, partial [Chloroflexi bacterium]|nr:CoA transferase [Chloroflexota bacterium]